MGTNLVASSPVPTGMTNMRPPPGVFNANLLRYQTQLGIPPNVAVPFGTQGNIAQAQANFMTSHMARPFGATTGHPPTQFYPGQAAAGMPVQSYAQLQSVMMPSGAQSQPLSMGGNNLTMVTSQAFPNQAQGRPLTSPMTMRFSSPPHTPFSPGGAPVTFPPSGSMPPTHPVSTPAVPLTPMANKSMTATVKQSLANRVFHNTFSSTTAAGSSSMYPATPLTSANRSHSMATNTTPTTSRKKSIKNKLGPTPAVSHQPIDNFSEDTMDAIRPLDLAIARYIYNHECMHDIFSLVPTNQLEPPTCPWDEMDPQKAQEQHKAIQRNTEAWQCEYEESTIQCRRRIETLTSLNQKIQCAETLAQLEEVKEAVDDLSRQICQPMGTLKTVKIDTYSLPVTGGNFISL
ncbi:hypothetical protein IWQ61_001530 [Dispira simplex]|nr:hypothetical protein IWQ61_001530 [Dispira simplex]